MAASHTQDVAESFEEIFYPIKEEPEIALIIYKVSRALRLAYGRGDQLAMTFIKFVRENGYTDDTETLTDDWAEEMEDSSIVEALAEGHADILSTNDQKLLLHSKLQSACNPSFSCKEYLKQKNITWTLTKKNAKDARDFLANQCRGMIMPDEDADLVDIVAVGFKNDKPLLCWLSDTYSRFIINRYLQNREQSQITVAKWEKHYTLIKQLLSKKNGKILANKVASSVVAYHKRLFQPILFTKMAKIKDDINEYIKYFIAVNSAVKTLKSDHIPEVHPHCPFHFDLCIIPRDFKYVTTDDDEDENEDGDSGSEDDDVDDEKQPDKPKKFGSLTAALEAWGWEFKEYDGDLDNENAIPPDGIGDFFNRQLLREIRNMIRPIENIKTRNQRLIIFVDRREKYSRANRQPVIVLARPKDRDNEKYSEIPKRHSPETFCWSTKKCLYPVDPEGGEEQGPELKFVVSWHAESEDLVRIYWRFGIWTTRFFPMDTIYLWPEWFDNPQGNGKKGLKVYSRTLLKFRQVIDNGFEEWFEHTTETSLESPWVPRNIVGNEEDLENEEDLDEQKASNENVVPPNQNAAKPAV